MNKRITTDILKITAMVSMLTDHVAVAFAGFGMPAGIYWMMRCIGRLAFPIYVYFLVQGYIYTHSVGKYAIKLGLLAVISEIPYDMTVYGCFFDFRHNNVLFTLVLALLVLWATDSLYKKNRWLVPVAAVIVIWTAALSHILGLDYSYRCILLALIFYYARQYEVIMYTAAAIISAISGSLASLVTPLALVPVYFHDGKKGHIPKADMWSFYPAHLLIIGMIRMFF